MVTIVGDEGGAAVEQHEGIEREKEEALVVRPSGEARCSCLALFHGHLISPSNTASALTPLPRPRTEGKPS